MKELKHTKTIEETYGYQATDGKVFNSKEECEKYEKTAEMVIYNDFKQLMVGGDVFAECSLWENYGYGSEEYEYAIIDIKNADDLRIANMYGEINRKGQLSPDYIGKRILVHMGYQYDRNVGWCAHTEEELIEDFKKEIGLFFHPKAKEGEANDKSEM